jgi:sterol desaturase/sphingolipid hydroxylase (fatty acid hydroxylase superfamily)
MSDEFLPDLSLLILISSLCCGIGLAVERLRPAERPEGAERVSLGLLYLVVYSTVLMLLTPLPRLATAVVTGWLGLGFIELPSAGWGLLWAIPVYCLAIDFLEYAFHRAQHRFPVLWAMHSLHHSARPMNATTTLRHFWLEPAIKMLCLYPLAMIFFQPSPVVLLVNALLSYWSFFAHLNLKLPFGRAWALVNNPDFHRLHHSAQPEHFNRNFADILPVFDLVFGTARRPAEGEAVATGLDTGEVPATIVEAVLWPWRRSLAWLSPSASAEAPR